VSRLAGRLVRRWLVLGGWCGGLVHDRGLRAVGTRLLGAWRSGSTENAAKLIGDVFIDRA
jgi:hypothetical protein